MDDETVARAIELSTHDKEFQLFAQDWMGSLSLECGMQAWQVAISAGLATSAPINQRPRTPGPNDVSVSAPVEVWDSILSVPPPPMFTDFFGASFVSDCRVSPPIDNANRHNALRRFAELLRHARNTSDPAPIVGMNVRRTGEHDAPIGRYLHLDLLGVDHRVYYESAGSGIPLLCQHTAGSDGRQWRHVLEDPRITDRFNVIAYDLPHHGKSLPPDSVAWWATEYRLTTDAAMAVPLALADALGLMAPVFMGSSIGGNLALDLACYHPNAFRAVVSLEGALKVASRENSDVSPVVQSNQQDPALHAGLMMMMMAPTAPERRRQETRFHYSQGAPGVFLGDLYYYQVDHDLTADVHRFDTKACAVFLLTGEYDAPTVPGTLEAARQISGAHMTIMKGLGHFPMSEDHEQFMTYLLPVLAEIETLPHSSGPDR